MIEPGATVEGYRVERMLGRGGMGVVYEAVQSSLERHVALKVLRPELADDASFVARFRREGRIQASLEHPNVLDVYEVGESKHGLFLAMRLVHGRTLLGLVQEGELDAGRALALMAQVGDALDAAHAAGLIHRDVKPQNILVSEGDEAFLADFGLTRAGSDTTLSGSRPLLGTVDYVAPEVVRGAEPTPASDRYAFAATLFHCLTGDVMFPRGSDYAVLYAHSSEPPPPASERWRALPEELDDVFARGLAKDPAERPGTAEEIVAAARAALGTRLGELGPPPLGAGRSKTPVTAEFPPEPGHRPDSAGGRRRLVVMAVLAGAAVVFGGVAAMVLDGEGDEAPEVPLPTVAEGAQPLGSDLAVPDRSVDCRGRAATPRSPSCSIVQSELAGSQLLAPSDGAIVGWSVRGANGELALDVIRPRGKETTRVARSQFEHAGNSGPYRFDTRLPVEAGDRIGVELGPGSAIGIGDSQGATTQRWLRPTLGAYGNADRGEGTGFDYEISLRAEFVPGATVSLPPHLTGREAATAPDGQVQTRNTLKVSGTESPLGVELIEVGNRVALDIREGDRRSMRIFIPGLRPGAFATGLRTYRYAGEPFGEADVWWVNPNTGRLIFHFFGISASQIEFWG